MRAYKMEPGGEPTPATVWTPEQGALIGARLQARVEKMLRDRKRARWAAHRDPDWAERAAAQAIAAPW